MCYLHNKKIMHRDLKPDNILITNNNTSENAEIVKIVDLGLADYEDLHKKSYLF